MVLSLAQLLVSLSVQVDESVDEVGDACTDVNEVDNDVFKIEVKRVRHVEATDFICPNDKKELHSFFSYLIMGMVLITRS